MEENVLIKVNANVLMVGPENDATFLFAYFPASIWDIASNLLSVPVLKVGLEIDAKIVSFCYHLLNLYIGFYF